MLHYFMLWKIFAYEAISTGAVVSELVVESCLRRRELCFLLKWQYFFSTFLSVGSYTEIGFHLGQCTI
jgi:hypothetical protein